MNHKTGQESGWVAELPKVRCAILMIDAVGSVKLIRDPQARFVERWRRLLREVRSEVLPRWGGRMVKSLGDGMLCVFDTAPAAVAAAADLRQRTLRANSGWEAERTIWLRGGANLDVVEVDEDEIYGAAVDLTQRLIGLARPGELVATAALRDEITDGVDALVEDLGECYLKHIDEPQRCFRLLPPLAEAAPARPTLPMPSAAALQTAVAVLPLRPMGGDRQWATLGDLLADQVTTSLSRTPQLRVISRLACAAVAQRELDPVRIGASLGARYLLGGSVTVFDGTVLVHAEVIDAASGALLWGGESRTRLADILAGEDPAVGEIVQAAGRTIIDTELHRSGAAPLPTLQSHELLLSAIAHIHRSSSSDFERARSMLDLLADRHGRLPHANSWLANWHAMHAVQGLCRDPEQAGRRAVDHANRALDTDARSSLALTMRGLVQGFLRRDLDAAEQDYEAALRVNPSEALAWLYLGTLRAWQGRGAEALTPAREALRLAPVGPLRYYFESLAGLAALAAGELQLAHDLSASSIRANRMHTSTHRTLAIAQWKLGHLEAARHTVADLLRVEPGFTAAGYRRRFPGGDTEFARENARILNEAGAPAR